MGIFGVPKKISNDNGLEFQNQELKRLTHRFQVKMFSTVAESLEQWGLRKNGRDDKRRVEKS